LKSLGYPRIVSLDSFRTPSFELVAHILHWLVKNYDPSSDIPLEISTEGDRVLFVKTIAQYLVTKAHIKINPRRLYAADGYAVKEIMKVASVLYDAISLESGNSETSSFHRDIRSNMESLKTCRSLASMISEKGTQLCNLLEREADLRDSRSVVISRPFEFGTLQAAVNDKLQQGRTQLEQMKTQLDQVRGDEANLRSKIEKKKQELDRVEKRMKSLQSVRPAFMDEYERVEQELQQWYQTYTERFRNLSFLEQQLEDFHRIEQEQFQEAENNMRKMQNKLREEELLLLRDVIPSVDLARSNIEDEERKPSGVYYRPAPILSRWRLLAKYRPSARTETFAASKVRRYIHHLVPT
ncbi:hypothetical protein M427DRAFT_94580, partial [Gonapodya prolifera JEL478]